MSKRYVTRTGRTLEERDRDAEFRETLAPPAQYYAADEPRVSSLGSERSRAISGLELFVGWIAGVINALLAIRFVLALLNANQGNGFVNFIYTATNGFTAPFANLFNYQVSTGVGYFDLPAMVAIIVVAFVAWALMRLLRIGRV